MCYTDTHSHVYIHKTWFCLSQNYNGSQVSKIFSFDQKISNLGNLLEGASEGARKPVYTDMSGFLNNKK